MSMRLFILGVLATFISLPAEAEEWSCTSTLAQMSGAYTVEGNRLLGPFNDYSKRRPVYEIERNSDDLLLAFRVGPINRIAIRTQYVMIDKRTLDFKWRATNSAYAGEGSSLGRCSKR